MSSAGGRAAMLIAQRGDLFVYGTLQFPEVLRALLGRIPDSSATTLDGWRAAALARRTYPGLVPANATVGGTLLTGLTAEELQVLDEYESGPYDLRKLSRPMAGRRGPTCGPTSPASYRPTGRRTSSLPSTCTISTSPRDAQLIVARPLS
jgi:gamma-glutamylcyclotransferase (GGCT)/AIG2-like uncharacterized protein YtfP